MGADKFDPRRVRMLSSKHDNKRSDRSMTSENASDCPVALLFIKYEKYT